MKAKRELSIWVKAMAAVGILVAPGTGRALAENCAGVAKDVVIEQKLAEASAWSNFRESKGSIAFESKRMLKKAEQGLENAAPPADICPADCKPPEKPQIIFTSIPNKFISGYSDEAHCKDLSQRTASKPFRFEDRRFKSIEELADWFGQFSQGKGDDGAALYEKCDGSCSPQYHCEISESGGSLTLDASVSCGAARDKDDNQYKLAVAYRWVCSPAA